MQLFSRDVILAAILFSTPTLSSTLNGRGVKKSTTTTTITKTTVTSVPFTIDTNINTVGVITLIPDALTISFGVVPAYFYLETFKTTTTTVTSTSKIVVAITSTPTSTTVKTTSTSTSSTSAPTASATGAASDAYASCFLQGSVPKSSQLKVFGSYTTDTIETCLEYCTQTTACQTYSYNPSTKGCINYSGSFATADQITAGITGVFFGSKGNYDGRMTCYESAADITSS